MQNMQKQKGVTLIELIVGIAIFAIFVLTIVGSVSALNGNSNVSIGINGVTEARCIEGYKFIINQDGHTRQILDELGKGVRCESIGFGKPGQFGKM